MEMSQKTSLYSYLKQKNVISLFTNIEGVWNWSCLGDWYQWDG
jgi:hypothetical protein